MNRLPIRFKHVSTRGVKYRIYPPTLPAEQKEISTLPPTEDTTPTPPDDLQDSQLPVADAPSGIVRRSDKDAVNLIETIKPPGGQIPETPVIVDEVRGKPRQGNRKKVPGQESFLPLGRRR